MTVKIETKGDVRVIACPKCGVALKVANMSPSNMRHAGVTCSKCHTTVEVARKD